jgi:hypothetical protein
LAVDPSTEIVTPGIQGQPTPQPAQQQAPQTPKPPGGSHKKYYAIVIIIIVIAVAGYAIASNSGIISGGSHGSAKVTQLYQAFKSGNYTGALTTMETSVGSAQTLNATYKGKITYSISLLGISQSGSSPILVKYMKAGQNSSFAFQILSNSTAPNGSSSSGASSLLGGLSGLGGSLLLNLDGNSYQCNASGGACTTSSSSTLSTLRNISKTSNVTVTNSKLSYSTYNGQDCVLSSGNYNIRANASTLTGGLGAGQSKTSIAGNYSICVSETYLIPLTLDLRVSNISIVSSGSTTSVAVQAFVELNATSINNNTNPNEIASQIELSGNCASILAAFAEYNCTNAQVGTNGVMKVTIHGTSAGFSTATNQGSAEVACLTHTLNFTTSLPSGQYININQIPFGGNETVTVPCYNSQGSVVSPAPGSIFIGILYIKSNSTFFPYEIGTVQTRVGSSPIAQTAQAPTTIPTTIPATIPQSNYTASSSNSTSCGSFSLSTPYLSTKVYGTCTWSGGQINVYAAGGDSGVVSYRISGGPSNATYLANTTNARCLSLVSTTYLPAQTYYLKMSTGAGGGACGNAELQLSST